MFLKLLMSLLLPSRRAVLIHASGVVIQGEGVIFLGDSGAGKTTTARRLGREGAMRIADDLTILHASRSGSFH
jgi:serine kinase of HPr protein (carbohydrate metabolism regulator)